MMTHRARLLSCSTIAVACGLYANSAMAADGFALDRFEPSERGSEWFSLESLDLRGHKRFAIGAMADYGYRPLVIYNADGSTRAAVVKHQLFLHPGATLTLFDRLRLGLSLPIAAWESGKSGTLGTTRYTAPNHVALGDLRLGADVRLVGHYGGPATMAFGTFLFLPTGSRSDYTSDGTVRVMPRLSFAGDLGPITYAYRLSMQIRPHSQMLDGAPVGSEVGMGAAVGLRVLDRKLVIGPEVYASTVVTKSNAAFTRRATPGEIIFGAHYQPNDWRYGLGAGPGLSRGFGAPEMRILASVEWAPQPKKKEVPLPPVVVVPPSDRDHDGVLDDDDACPDVSGVKTDDPSTNGCPLPPPDRDHDGIIDSEDACPDVPGVKTDDPLTNGCPPPPPDRDADKIIDSEDACPDAKGSKNEDPKKNGCPEVRVESGQIKIIEQVKFKTDSAVILPESETILSAIKQILEDHPEITALSIEGHTDGRGQKQHNRILSRNRAAAVVTWLTKHGIAKERLSSKGFGPDQPIDTNDTDEGRQNNRRVELHIVESGETKGVEIREVKGTGGTKKAVK